MTIQTLICRLDGTQELIHEELPDSLFETQPEEQREENEES